jgi:hypothetical protein
VRGGDDAMSIYLTKWADAEAAWAASPLTDDELAKSCDENTVHAVAE